MRVQIFWWQSFFRESDRGKNLARGESTVVDREINVEVIALFSWSNDEFDKEIAALPLENGPYRIVVETTRAAPDTKGTPIIFSVQRANRGT
ncbi:DUF5625 family protein [Cupriavidus oxalaticus]|uniref:DUF5625 family protein n=1 Tax=Cupriavidus oxalaticus TaxID=96344 RepID=UPI001245DB03|nr:hypothetical protein [Cupriavidus oxalaticus]